MSYAAIFIVPLVLAAVIASALVLLAAFARPPATGGSWPRASLGLFGMAVAQFTALWGIYASTHTWLSRRLTVAPPAGWERQHVEALQSWEASRIAASYLPSCLAALLAGIVAFHFARVSWSPATRRVTLALFALASALPAVLAVGWVAPTVVGHPASDDVRWSVGYVAEWLNAGAPEADGGGVCYQYSGLATAPPERGFSAAELQALRVLEQQGARDACQHVCAYQRAAGPFNPGALENYCSR